MRDSADQSEEHSRRNCLLLHGVRELEGKNTNDVIMKTVTEKMDIDTRKDDLYRAHRVDNPKESKEVKPTAIIIKSARHDVRNTMYKNKKEFER